MPDRLIVYRNRADAGTRLADAFGSPPGSPVVLAIPRGGVVVGAAVAERLGAPLDVIVVRKLGVPSQPELAMGALGEGGTLVVYEEALRAAGVTSDAFDAVWRAEEVELERRIAAYRRGRTRIALEGRPVIVVDDGVATGSSAQAACQVAWALGASLVTLGTPVGPPDVDRRFEGIAEVVCPLRPASFSAIGDSYLDFSPTSDAEVLAVLAGRPGPAP